MIIAWKRPEFEKWASSKGFRLECEPSLYYVDRHYKDPITQAAWEGYQRALNDHQPGWQHRNTAAMNVITDNNLWEAYEKELEAWADYFGQTLPNHPSSSRQNF